MARARSERARSKTLALDDLTQSIEQLQAFLPKVEDLGREGFPYLDGARGRTELQLRECIKRAFGDKSPEYQTHRHHKLSVSSPSDTKQTVTLIRDLIATLEEKKRELQGHKVTAAEDATQAIEPVRPQMTLVPPSAPHVPVPASPISPTTETHSSLTAAISTSEMTAPSAPTPPAPVPTIEACAPPSPVAPSVKPMTQRPPLEPISSLFRTQETRPVHPTTPPVQPSAVLPPSPSAAPATFTSTQELHKSTQASPSATLADAEYLTITKRLFQRFHVVARQLRLRGEYRSTLEVADEVDVQDLLHALLRLQFDDISTDEWTPGYTDGAHRTTFLLNHDRLAIVVKKTRPGLSVKDLGDQVRMDIERHRTHGRCTHLMCFIYDPDGRIGNPRGLEREFSSTSEHLNIDVVVAPK